MARNADICIPPLRQRRRHPNRVVGLWRREDKGKKPRAKEARTRLHGDFTGEAASCGRCAATLLGVPTGGMHRGAGMSLCSPKPSAEEKEIPTEFVFGQKAFKSLLVYFRVYDEVRCTLPEFRP